MTPLSEILRTLSQQLSAGQELDALTSFSELLHPLPAGNLTKHDACIEDELLERDNHSWEYGEKKPSVLLTNVLPSQADLDTFVCYIFERRYGWSEGEDSNHRKSSKFIPTKHDVEHKVAINETLDEFLDW